MGGGAKGGAGSSTRLVEDDAKALRELPEIAVRLRDRRTRARSSSTATMNWQTQHRGHERRPAADPVVADDVRRVLHRGGRPQRQQGDRARRQRRGQPVRRRRRSDRQVIRVRNHVFKVLGVMARKGASGGGQNQDDQVFAPYTTVMKKLSGQQNLNRILRRRRSRPSRSPAPRPSPSPPRCASATRSRRATPTTSRSRRRTTSSRSARRRRAR